MSVAIGVAALTGVRGFSAAFRSMLLLRARSIMAADIAARMGEAPTPVEQAAIAKLPGLDDDGGDGDALDGVVGDVAGSAAGGGEVG